MKEYQNRIRAIREDQDLKQRELAGILHISQRAYSGYETGYRNAPVEVYIRLAEFYDVDMNYILGTSEEKRPFPKK